MPRGPKPTADPQRPDQRKHPIKKAERAGWQHGEIPAPPSDDLKPSSVAAWNRWFNSWWASFWTVEDLPMLALIVAMYDKAQVSGDTTKLTPLLDRYGITPKGRQDLRWAPPEADEPEKPTEADDELEKRRKARKLA